MDEQPMSSEQRPSGADTADGADGKPGQRQHRIAGASSGDKGRIVESIVAAMHELSGVSVERNVCLPGAGPRKREIDVLVSGSLGGYPVRIAIECKNEKRPVGAPKVDAFVGKLMDVGIPLQHGIFVSASGYTNGAVARAQSAGLRTLVLTGLDEARLASSVAEAFQSVTYLLLDVVRITVANNVPSVHHPQDILVFYDRDGCPRGSLPDLIWQQWLRGELPATIGEHEINAPVPDGWCTLVDGKAEPVLGAWFGVRVLGLVITIRGRSEQHLLVNAADKTVERLQVRATFDDDDGAYPVNTVQTESELSELLSKSGGLTLDIGRIRLPRIRLNSMYWPPSERTARKVSQLMEAFLAGRGPDPRPMEFAAIEGTDLRTIWEPTCSANAEGPADQAD